MAVVVQAFPLREWQISKVPHDMCYRLRWKIFLVPASPHLSRALLLLRCMSSRHGASSTTLRLIDITCLFINRKGFMEWSRLYHTKADMLCSEAEAHRLCSLVVQRCKWQYMSVFDGIALPITQIRVRGRWQLPLGLPKLSLPRCLIRYRWSELGCKIDVMLADVSTVVCEVVYRRFDVRKGCWDFTVDCPWTCYVLFHLR